MDEQKQDDQQESTYSSSVRIRDVALKTCRKQWTIEMGGERESGISLLMARRNDDTVLCDFTFKNQTDVINYIYNYYIINAIAYWCLDSITVKISKQTQ